MQCSRCQHENPAAQKFCGECGARLALVCPSCGASNPPAQKFCGECGTGLAPTEGTAKYGTPQSYTPKHLAEKILTSKAALEGERKMVTVLFADLKGSMELLADRDPRQLASELTLGRVVTWRTEIEDYNRYFRFRASRFLAPSAAAGDAEPRLEGARKKLGQLGASQLRLYSQRGKRPLPPAHIARGFCYGLLCLLQGLRAMCSEKQDAGIRTRQLETEGSDFLGGLASLQGASPFLPYVRLAIALMRDQEILTHAGLPGGGRGHCLASRWTRQGAHWHLGSSVLASAPRR